MRFLIAVIFAVTTVAIAQEVCVDQPAVVCDAYETGARGNIRYRRVETAAKTCTSTKLYRDGGVELTTNTVQTLQPRANIEIVAGSCVPASTVATARSLDAGVAFLPLACACRMATGTCQYVNKLGTLVNAPRGKTLGPGYAPYVTWSGAGCQPKACAELLGESSWPAVCPRR